MLTPEETKVKVLGEPQYPSPLNLSTVYGDGIGNFVPEDSKVRFQVELIKGQEGQEGQENIFFEKSGPLQKIYFKPEKTKAAIVTCGGLCPGINDVIRSIYLELFHNYKVRDVYGIKYGYLGMNPARGEIPVKLTSEFVEQIHKMGGSALGSSRGNEDPVQMADFLDSEGIDILFCIGGDGTLKGANAIYEAVTKKKFNISIIGIPKTIDNDIMYVWKTFGFSTAVEKASEVLDCAHVEAQGAPHGISLVKVMGRDSGFIASAATLASQEVNFTLIPEISFELEGEKGFLNALHERLLSRKHAVVVVAEGAGQDLIRGGNLGEDASGNVRYKDIGLFLKDKILEYFKEKDFPVTLKYIDPSYIIRSVAANGDDSLFCNSLGRAAVHAGMSGKTDMLVGIWHNSFINVPISLCVRERKKIDPESAMWQGVLESTGQPHYFRNDNKNKKKISNNKE
ncbi:ATP-dependent 6-phosphofructokinase [candidate division KSB1 bacterium]